MDTVKNLDVVTLADDDLFELFGVADDGQNNALAATCAAEIKRRSELPCDTVTNAPAWLQKLLPSFMWHQKPRG